MQVNIQGQKSVYSCEYVKQILFLFINFCIIFHVNTCKPTFALPCVYLVLHKYCCLTSNTNLNLGNISWTLPYIVSWHLFIFFAIISISCCTHKMTYFQCLACLFSRFFLLRFLQIGISNAAAVSHVWESPSHSCPHAHSSGL